MDLGLALAAAAFALGLGATLLALAAGAFEPDARGREGDEERGRTPDAWAAVLMPDGTAALARRA